MSFVKGLKCRECGKDYPKEALHVCSQCFGPLEVDYEYERIKKELSREKIKSRGKTMWRYRELLPLDGEPTVGTQVGFTPLVKANNLAKKLGVDELYVKNDSVNYPTYSFKDRVVSAALSKAKELGFKTVACATTGNLGNSVAAQAVQGNLESYIFMPANLEQGKVIGTSIYGTNIIGINGNYDGVNRMCSEIADKYGWAFANINIRPYYGDGSKSYGYEIAEQLGWKTPDNVIVPVAGSSLITKIWKAFHEFEMLGLLEGKVNSKIFAAQATGCSPVTTAIKNDTDVITPVKPNTIAKSIAIGNPADGYYGVKTTKDSGGYGEDVNDEEIVLAMRLLAETEGIFTETAGGVTVGVTKKLVQQGRIKPDETTVICITGNGLKTVEALSGQFTDPIIIEPKLNSFEEIYSNRVSTA